MPMIKLVHNSTPFSSDSKAHSKLFHYGMAFLIYIRFRIAGYLLLIAINTKGKIIVSEKLLRRNRQIKEGAMLTHNPRLGSLIQGLGRFRGTKLCIFFR
ncbi:MAG: hypothetical protein ACI9DM_002203 [Cyclobacteriaceae bacterium]|jgi:hypothetical protein